MAQVLGVGGIFFKAKDGTALRDWYKRVLGLDFADWGGVVFRPEPMAAQPGAATVFCTFNADTDYFDKAFMINLVVDDLDGVLLRAADAGVTPTKLQKGEANGDFAHIVDPESNKVELWQPKPMA
ncbi:MAG: VOC family protein [Pseudomonadota bacterium]